MQERTYNAVLVGPPPLSHRQVVDAEFVNGQPQAELESFDNVDGIVVINIYRVSGEPGAAVHDGDIVEYHWVSVESVPSL